MYVNSFLLSYLSSITRFLILSLISLFIISCSDHSDNDSKPTPPTPPQVSPIVSIEVTPFTADIVVGSEQQFLAIATRANGNKEDLTPQVSWQSLFTDIAAHQDEGVFIGVSAGSSEITATYESFTSNVRLNVVNADIEQLVILPHAITQPAGSNSQFTALAYLTDQSTINVTENVSWSSSDQAIATINSSGDVNFISVGEATISAELLGSSASANVTVSQATLVDLIIDPIEQTISQGGEVQYQAVGVYSDGSYNLITANATWQSEDEAIATITPEGLALTHSSGDTTINAQFESLSASASLTVVPSELTHLQIIPSSISANAGTSEQLILLASFSDGSSRNVASFAQWSSDNSDVAYVFPSGENAGYTTFNQAGETNIYASYQGVSSSVGVMVNAVTLVEISLSPLNSTIPLTGTLQYSATGIYSDGSSENLTDDVSWQSSDLEVALIDMYGKIQPLSAGVTLVTAFKEGISSQTSLTVSAAVLMQLQISPASVTTPIGGLESLQAIAQFDDGSVLDVTHEGLWNSQYESIAFVKPMGNLSGLLLGRTVGQTAVSFTYQGMSQTIEATVTSAALTSIIINPINSSTANGLSQQYYATGIYSDGSHEELNEEVTWQSSNSDVALIDLSGLAQSYLVGTTNITASFGEIVASTSLTVNDATIVDIQVFPPLILAQVGSNGPLTALARYSDNSSIDVSDEATWLSTNNNVVAVSNSEENAGYAIAFSQGEALISVNFNGLTSTARASIKDVTLTSISVSPITESTHIGTQVSYQATGLYSDGSSADLSDEVNWQSSNIDVATIDTFGVATTEQIGTTTITATFTDIASQATLTVTSSVVVGIQIQPANLTAPVETNNQYNAIAYFNDGTSLDVTSQATWQSSDITIISVIPSGADGGLTSFISDGSAAVSVNYQGETTSVDATAYTVALSSIDIVPTQATTPSGTLVQYSAIGHFNDGSSVDLSDYVTWQSSNHLSVVIDHNGLAYTSAVGQSTISATADVSFGDVSASTLLTVTNAVVTAVQILPGDFTQPVGINAQLKALAFYSDQTVIEITEIATWSSSNSQIVSVVASGENAGYTQLLNEGSSSISLNYNNAVASISVDVTASELIEIQINPLNESIAQGSIVQFQAVGIFTDGSSYVLENNVNWQSSDTAIATIDANGLATGIATGSNSNQTAEISASLFNVTSKTNLTITAVTIESIDISPSETTQAVGTKRQYTAMATFSDGNTQNITSIANWQSSNNSVVQINSVGENIGFASMLSEGAVTISASFDGVSAQTNATVTAADLITIEVTPLITTVASGLEVQYSAVGIYSNGDEIPINESVSWLSSDIAVATINLSGLAIAQSVGVAEITASLNGITGHALLTVTNAVIINIKVMPIDVTAAAGGSQHLTANAFYSDGSIQNITQNSVWVSSAPNVATVDNTGDHIGLVNMLANGTSTITASYQSKTAVSNIVVSSAELSEIKVTPFVSTLATGLTQQYSVTGIYSDGSASPITEGISWTSSIEPIASIDINGLANALSVGTTIITATVGEFTAQANLAVTNATLISVHILPSDFSQPSGVSGPLFAIAYLTDGSTVDITSNGTWSTSNDTIVDIVPTGLYAGFALLKNQGDANVTFSFSGETDTITVTVTPAALISLALTPLNEQVTEGQTVQYQATGSFSDGSSYPMNDVVTWTSSETITATIDSTGLARALSSGDSSEATTVISATYDGISVQTNLTVEAIEINLIQITPAVGEYPQGLFKRFNATAYLSNNTSVDITEYATWSSSDEAIVQVIPSGVQGGIAYMTSTGNANITAQLNGVSGLASVTVTPVTLVSIEVEPFTNSLAIGLSEQYRAIGHFSDNSNHDITDYVSWQSLDPSIADVSLTGMVTSQTVGSTSIQAQYEDKIGSASITITAAVITGIQITPADINDAKGFTHQLTATATFSDNSQLTVTESATWSSAAPAIASITATGVGAGLLTLEAEGATTITVNFDGTSDVVNVTVTAAVLTEIQVTPTDANIPVGVTQAYSAHGILSDGTNGDITTDVSWSSSATSIVTINATTGVATSVAAGTSTITATYGEISDAQTLTVTAPVLVSIAVTPATATKLETQTQQFEAIGTYDNADTANITDIVTWTSDASAIASISNAAGSEGLATAIAEGAAKITAQYTPEGGSLLSDTADFTVTGPAIVEVIILPDLTSIVVGQQTQWTANAKDEFGNVFDITNDATWVSSVTATATVLAGNITGIYGGENDSDSQMSTITVSYGGASDSADITVNAPATLASNIYPSSQHLIVGTTGQVGAVIAYSDGNIRRATQAVTWASSDPSVATITSFNPNGGKITAVGVGSTNITYSFEGDESDYAATILVEDITDPIQIIPSTNFSITDGSYYRMQAFATFSNGEQIDLWHSVGWGNTDSRTRFVPHNYSLEHQDPLFHQKEIHGIYRAGGDSGGQTGPKDIYSSLPYEDEDHEFASDLVTVTVTGKCPNMTYAGPGLFSGNGEGENPVDSLILSPMNATMALGEYLQLNLEVEKGGCVGNVTFGSASFAIKAGEPENVVSFDPEVGRLFAINTGTTTIVATYNQGQSVETTVTVSGDEVAFVKINPLGPTVVNVGESLSTFTCGIRFMSNGVIDGGDVDITGTGIWSVDDDSIISLGANDGVNQTINADAAGTTFVRCTDPNGTKFGFHEVVVQ